MPPTALPATGDTWGISGPAFLGLYLAAFAALSAWIFLQRRSVGGRSAGGRWNAHQADLSSLPPEEIGLIAAGPNRAAEVVLADLYDAGALVAGSRRRTIAAGPGRVVGGEVARTAYQLVAAAGQVRVPDFTRAVAGGPAMAAATDRLVAVGLVPTAEQTRAARRAALWYLPLLGLGIVRAVVGSSHGKPVGFLGILLVVTALALLGAGRTPVTTTGAGRHALGLERRRSTGLKAGGLPGQRGAAVALFGPAVLWAADPAIASQLGIARPSSGDGSSSSSCGGGGCGGGGCGG